MESAVAFQGLVGRPCRFGIRSFLTSFGQLLPRKTNDMPRAETSSLSTTVRCSLISTCLAFTSICTKDSRLNGRRGTTRLTGSPSSIGQRSQGCSGELPGRPCSAFARSASRDLASQLLLGISTCERSNDPLVSLLEQDIAYVTCRASF